MLKGKLNEDIEDASIDILAKWKIKLNDEEMTQYFIETNLTEEQWM